MVVRLNLARGKIFTTSIGSDDSLYLSELKGIDSTFHSNVTAVI